MSWVINMNDSEQSLVANLGIYGCWLLKHAAKIGPSHPDAKAIYSAYEMYALRSGDHAAAAVLLDAIEKFIEMQNYEPLKSTYDEALEDLLEYRRTSSELMV